MSEDRNEHDQGDRRQSERRVAVDPNYQGVERRKEDRRKADRRKDPRE